MILYIRVKNGLFIRLFNFFYKSKFKKFGNKSSILFPLNLSGINNISIDDNVCIDNKSWLAAVPHTGEGKCELIIGEGSRIGNFNHIYATKSIIIGKNVLTADKVYISDNLHGYEDINLPILKQPIKQIGIVKIGDGSWLGEHVCVIGANIGKHCVIGANSVVTNDIPDYSVAVGVPAKVIKRYCFDKKEWKKCDDVK
jgi:acetyltransferase-like isoleucine patch superfamily enzyme